MRHEVRLYRICWAMFCPSVNGLYCSSRPASRARTWPIVSRWCITRFSLCLSADCESHLTGLALSSPAWMRRGGTQQDASTAFSFFAKRAAWDRKREGTGVQREWKCDLCSSFSVFARHALELPAHTKRSAFEARLVISRHFFLLCETLEFRILKLYFMPPAICSFFFFY